MSEEAGGIVTSERDGILEISIDRPDRRNALTHAMYRDLTAALQRAESEDAIRVVLVTGTRDCFTAGNDMTDFLQNPPTGDDSPVMHFLAALPAMAKPLVAAVNGPAVGVGTTMLLHCDLVYLGASARLQMPFVNLGLCPEAGSSLLLPLLMGHHRAAELLMLGETLDAQRALDFGMANAVFGEEDYLEKAREQALRLAAQPPASVRLTKAFLKQGHRDELSARMNEEGKVFMERLSSPEAREAMQAFMEKRKPDFSRFS